MRTSGANQNKWKNEKKNMRVKPIKNPIRPRGGEGGADMTPPRANTYIPLKINGWKFWQLLCIPKCMLDTLETTFQGKKTFCLVKGSLSWSETPYFHKGGPLWMVPQMPLSAEMKEKNILLSSYILGTKWLRHQQWVLNWRFLREINCKPIFEQVTPSRSPGKSEYNIQIINVQI